MNLNLKNVAKVKKYFQYYVLIVLSILLFSSCNNPKQEQEKQPDQQSSNSATKQIERVTLKAVGNTMAEMKYDLDEISVKRNSKVILTLINDSVDETMKHNVLIVKKGAGNKVGMAAISLKDKNYIPDMPEVIAASDLAKPGETVRLEFDAPAPGNYEFLCTFPGHHSKMKGILKVL